MSRFRSRSTRFRGRVRKLDTDWYHVISSGHVAPTVSSQAWCVPPDGDGGHYPDTVMETDRVVLRVIIQGLLAYEVQPDSTFQTSVGLLVVPEDTATGLPASNDFPNQGPNAPWLWRGVLVGQTDHFGGNQRFFLDLGANSALNGIKTKRKLPARHGLAIIINGDDGTNNDDVGFGYDVRTLVQKG